ADAVCDRSFESIEDRSRRQHLSAQDCGYSSNVLVVDKLTAVSEKTFTHICACCFNSRSISRCKAGPSSRCAAELLAYSKSSETAAPGTPLMSGGDPATHPCADGRIT